MFIVFLLSLMEEADELEPAFDDRRKERFRLLVGQNRFRPRVVYKDLFLEARPHRNKALNKQMHTNSLAQKPSTAAAVSFAHDK